MLRPVAGSEVASARVGCQSREDNLCRPRQEAAVLKGEFRDRLRHRRHLTSVNVSASLVDTLDSALESIGCHRATLGAAEHRLQAAAETSELRLESWAHSLDRLTSADPAATASAWRSAKVQQYAAISMFRRDASAMQRLLSLFG